MSSLRTVSYTHFRQNLKEVIEHTVKNHEPVLIISRDHYEKAAVLISYEDYCHLEETAYLLGSMANSDRLAKAKADIGTKAYKKHRSF